MGSGRSLVGWVSVACDAQPTMSFGGLRRLRRLTHPTTQAVGRGPWKTRKNHRAQVALPGVTLDNPKQRPLWDDAWLT